jgi:hypothetical protein
MGDALSIMAVISDLWPYRSRSVRFGFHGMNIAGQCNQIIKGQHAAGFNSE